MLPAATPIAPAFERDDRGDVVDTAAVVVVGGGVVKITAVLVLEAVVVLAKLVELSVGKLELEATVVLVTVDVVVLAGVAGTVVVTVVKLEEAVNEAEKARQSALPMD